MKNCRGFTIVELMFTLAIAGVLMGLAAPSFKGAALNSRLVSKHNELVSALQLARSEAITRSSNVSVCARASDSTCGTDWGNGWLVFTDQGATRGSVDAGEVILAIAGALHSSISLANSAKLAAGAGKAVGRPHIRYSARGNSNWRGGGSFFITDNECETEARALNITMSGGVKKATKDGDGDLIDAFGSAVSCSTEEL